jgi:hypothetical protein
LIWVQMFCVHSSQWKGKEELFLFDIRFCGLFGKGRNEFIFSSKVSI